ncbi:MAG: hypothetical protein LBQ12_00605, partial [Deltaproteobacteria bacterium]|nr:hypothetical protein [Deltaproteobacteria bacterium]
MSANPSASLRKFSSWRVMASKLQSGLHGPAGFAGTAGEAGAWVVSEGGAAAGEAGDGGSSAVVAGVESGDWGPS